MVQDRVRVLAHFFYSITIRKSPTPSRRQTGGRRDPRTPGSLLSESTHNTYSPTFLNTTNFICRRQRLKYTPDVEQEPFLRSFIKRMVLRPLQVLFLEGIKRRDFVCGGLGKSSPSNLSPCQSQTRLLRSTRTLDRDGNNTSTIHWNPPDNSERPRYKQFALLISCHKEMEGPSINY